MTPTLLPPGKDWCSKFPTSTSISDLIEPFRSNVLEFISELESKGAKILISTTYRPPERAYLMHYCCMIAQSKQAPDCITPMEGVDINWDCNNPTLTISLCKDMMSGYGIEYPAALISRHTQRRAIDMTISGFNLSKQDLWGMGKGFGVIKLTTDDPHWSDDGH